MDFWAIKDGFPLWKNPFGKGRESYGNLNEEYSRSFLWRHLASVSLSLQDKVIKEMEDETFPCQGNFRIIWLKLESSHLMLVSPDFSYHIC